MSIARHHAEWLSLVEVSGPFLSMPVLLRVFPQGLNGHDAELSRTIRQALEEWQDNQQGLRPDPAIHRAWVRFVLCDLLGFSADLLQLGPAIPESLKVTIAEHGETLRPDMVIQYPNREPQPRVLVQVVPPSQQLDKPLKEQRWKASPSTRMAELLRGTGVRLGLLTNGDHWMLVHAQPGETAGFISWYASLWLDEPLTLRAFRSLLSVDRLYGVADADTLEAMLTESSANQQEVTDQLGYQVREAVEVLVQTFDRIDKDDGRKLLDGVNEATLYEAALTVMMRLVFLFSAEERDLLLLGKPMYDQHYAVSTLRAQLREAADAAGEEVLERRSDAWSRLLATFRAVFAGVQHEDLRLPAYGGRLFDPDRFPFLEGRPENTHWKTTHARPLPVDNRTVLHLLEALQILRVAVPGGGPAEPRRLSFRALDIEQIGHVYEGLLDHTAKRASEPVLGLVGSRDREPEVRLSHLEKLVREHGARSTEQAPSDPQTLNPSISFLREETGRSANALANALNTTLDPRSLDMLRAACDNDADLVERVRPFAGLLRRDTFGRPVVITTGSVYVTTGTDRRTSGTHYTPRSLTEPIVQHTLEPLVYHGPAAGLPKEQWQLHSAEQILALQICDMAMGSGAFLVQACRYLAERLAEAAEGRTPGSTPDQVLDELFSMVDPEERLAQARRLVADRCLYGVDKNPLAVEMAKLSLWLVTLQKDRPFSFLDHALRHGDSLLGISHVEQLTRWSLRIDQADPKLDWVTGPVERALQQAFALRREIRTTPVLDVRDAERKAHLLARAEQTMALIYLGANLLVAAALAPNTTSRGEYHGRLLTGYAKLLRAANEGRDVAHTEAELRREAKPLLADRKLFHWPLEFPEVVGTESASGGFAAIIGNPPFQGGQRITGALGTPYRDYLVDALALGQRGSADLCAYFFLRAGALLQRGGMAGLIATNTIAQGDTREVGLDQLVAREFTIPRAVPSRPWPGTAGVEVAHVWLHHGPWQGGSTLDEQPVSAISPLLSIPGSAQGNPHRLKANAGKSFQGSIVVGMGFVLTPEEAQALIAKDPRNRDALFPYLNGEDLNSRPDQSPSRWVINFQDWPLERAESYPDLMAIVREKVKPERERNNLKAYRDYWWQFAARRPTLYTTIAGMERVLVIPRVSKFLTCSWRPIGDIASEATVVIACSFNWMFCILQNTFHDEWARAQGSTLETRMRYSPTDCFETFPFPPCLDTANVHAQTAHQAALRERLEQLGAAYHSHRQALMGSRQEGLTKSYNRFHDPYERSSDIAELRRLHIAMDSAVAAAYGWDALNLDHGFHQTKQGLRFTVSEAARREILDRLLALNHQRYAEEVAAGLHDQARRSRKGSKGSAKTKQSVGVQGELF